MSGVHYYQLDLTDFEAIESTAETIRREHGDPTVLINNAGIGGCQKSLLACEEILLTTELESHWDENHRNQCQAE